MPQDFWDDRNAHLQHLPDHILFDIARNDAAERGYRLHAVEILVTRKSPRVKHPELQPLIKELEIELEGIQFEFPAPTGSGPLVASITTETLHSDGLPISEISANAENASFAEKDTDARQDG